MPPPPGIGHYPRGSLHYGRFGSDSGRAKLAAGLRLDRDVRRIRFTLRHQRDARERTVVALAVLRIYVLRRRLSRAPDWLLPAHRRRLRGRERGINDGLRH